MITDKVGNKSYLGIEINYDKESKLDKFSLDTLKDRYLWEKESHAQEAFARASVFGATYKGETDFDLAQRLYQYSSDCWFMFSTPILSNGGTTRGLPISCFLNYVPDSRRGLSDHYDENIWLASSGGGISGYWGDVSSNGIATRHGSRSTGSIPFMHVVDSEMLAFNQGITRRGSYAAYSDIDHPEIEEFINMRKESGGDINRKCLNIHNAVNLTDGLDGLAIMPTVLVGGALGVFAYVTGNINFSEYLGIPYVAGTGEILVFCAALSGAGLGFLWFNTYPAQVFMGDIGALSLGAALGVVAVVVRQEIVLAIMGGVFVVETLSVMIQVASFKLTGKLVFRMAPLHHHFELKGWAEPKVIVRFWIITVILVLIGLASLKIR